MGEKILPSSPRDANDATEPLPTLRQRLAARGPARLTGVPPQHTTVARWLIDGMARYPAGVLVSVALAWTLLWLSVLSAMVGTVVGILVVTGKVDSSIFGHALIRVGGLESISFTGILLGALWGFVDGLLFVFTAVVVAHPSQFLFSWLFGAVGATLVTAAVGVSEPWWLKTFRREIEEPKIWHMRQLGPLISDVQDKMGLVCLPRILVENSNTPQASARMRTVVFTTDLLDRFQRNPRELEAIIAHELHHWRRGDAVGRQMVWCAALPVVLIYSLAQSLRGPTVVSVPMGASGTAPVQIALRTRNLGSGLVSILASAVAMPSYVMVHFVIMPVMRRAERRYEFDADAAAAAIGLGDPLAKALRKVEPFSGKGRGWRAALAATHPSTDARVERLRVAQPGDEDFRQVLHRASELWPRRMRLPQHDHVDVGQELHPTSELWPKVMAWVREHFSLWHWR
jgi:Zn-dependent protease with chaperone function